LSDKLEKSISNRVWKLSSYKPLDKAQPLVQVCNGTVVLVDNLLEVRFVIKGFWERNDFEVRFNLFGVNVCVELIDEVV